MKGFTEERPPHGTRWEFPIASRVPPVVNPVEYSYNGQTYNIYNPHFPKLVLGLMRKKILKKKVERR